jgi:hypothetical protein
LSCIEKRVVRFGFKETNGTSKGGKALKPSPRGLFETVEGFEETTNVSGTRGVDEPRGLLAVDFFGKIAVKKGVFDV